MAQQSYPFDAGTGAAADEAQWQAMARRFLATGVISGSLNQLAVTASGAALSVSVATGDAFIEGFFYRNDAALALTIGTANATNPRIDTVVVRLDRTANTAVLAVVAGTAAASPVAPALSQTDTLYELPLANVTVPAAAGVIVSGNVADRRLLTRNVSSLGGDTITVSGPTVKGLVVKGAAAQTANLEEFQTSAGTPVLVVNSLGGLILSNFGTGLGGTMWSGAGAPSNTFGSNGDYYFRTGTPGAAGQRIYVKDVGVWGGIV